MKTKFNAIATPAEIKKALLSGFMTSVIFLVPIDAAPIIDAIMPDAPIKIGYRKFSGEPISAAIKIDARIVTI